MFHKILIANRGEIACRIIETAHRLGIQCVAVYSEADRNARHVALADEAFLIGPAPSRDSYLKMDTIIEVAQRAGAQAVHPGYGFLSENAEFARKLDAAGLIFIGPPTGAIEAMGSKSAAKQIMEKAGVPLVPGYHGDNQDKALIRSEAERCGYPVLLKAVAGGGGKGMRVVWSAAEFDDAFDAAKREGESSFGNGDLLVEKYLTKPRHVEVQVFADQHGNAVYLGDRDCSVQRRHQKVIEEAPAPNIPEAIRRSMGEAAVKAAQAINYCGAGTVEFLYDEDGSFYFMEMNTRLQVEHPVTEKVTGQDLVEWQLNVAAGQPLPLSQESIRLTGHSLEVRVYAEDPDADFMPATGTLHYLQTPEENEHVRVDTGVIQGDEVSHYYDPMIAKLIVWDENRERALHRLTEALKEYRISGVTTNLGFLTSLASHPAFRRFDVDTGFIGLHHDSLLAERAVDTSRYLALSALILTLHRKATASNPDDPTSPFNRNNDWRLNLHYTRSYPLRCADQLHEVHISEGEEGYRIRVDGSEYLASGTLSGDRLSAVLNGHRFALSTYVRDNQLTLFHDGHTFSCEREVQRWEDESGQHQGSLAAPMTGTVVAVLKQSGDLVAKGEGLMVIEAMKMEQTIHAPYAGTVGDIYFQAGELVDGGVDLLALNALEDSPEESRP